MTKYTYSRIMWVVFILARGQDSGFMENMFTARSLKCTLNSTRWDYGIASFAEPEGMRKQEKSR